MYGYILFDKANRLDTDGLIATPATWQFEKGGYNYGGIEGNLSSEQQAQIKKLGGDYFDTVGEFNDWLTDETKDINYIMKQYRKKIEELESEKMQVVFEKTDEIESMTTTQRVMSTDKSKRFVYDTDLEKVLFFNGENWI